MRLRLILSATVAAAATYAAVLRDARRSSPRRYDGRDVAPPRDGERAGDDVSVFLTPFSDPGDLTPADIPVIDELGIDLSFLEAPRSPTVRFTGRDRTPAGAPALDPFTGSAPDRHGDAGPTQRASTASVEEVVGEAAPEARADIDAERGTWSELGRVRLRFGRPDEVAQPTPGAQQHDEPLTAPTETAATAEGAAAPTEPAPSPERGARDPEEAEDPSATDETWAWGAPDVAVGEIDLPDVATRSGALAELRRLTPLHGVPRVNLAYTRPDEDLGPQGTSSDTVHPDLGATPAVDRPTLAPSVTFRSLRPDLPFTSPPVAESPAATEILATGDFSVAGLAHAPGEGTVTAVTFPDTLSVVVPAEAIELVTLDLVNVVPDGVVVMDDEGFAPNADGFVLMIVSADTGAFSARGTYRVT